MKLISPDSMVGFSEAQKVASITKVFQDSYKSPLSVIVVDNIERLLGQYELFLRYARANSTDYRFHAHWSPFLQRRIAGPDGSPRAATAKGLSLASVCKLGIT